MASNRKKDYGSGSFRKRGSKYEYRVSYSDNNGITRSKSFSGRTQRECYRRAEDFFIELERQKLGTDKGNTISAILRTKYQADFEMNFIAEQGYNRNLEFLRILEDSPVSQIPIYDVTVDDLERYMKSIINYSNSVIEKLHLQIKQAFKEGVRRGFITDNIMEIHEIRRPKSNKPTKKVRGLTEEEQKLFTESLENYPIPKHGQHYKRQLLIELYTGMRMGEINALAPEDIDFNRSLIHVHKTVSTGLNNRSFISDTTKTDAGNRYVPINNLVKSILEESVSDMKSNPEGLIFYNHRRGSIINTSQVNSYFNRVAEKAGIDITGQHSLRHTFATRCIEAGITPVVLKTWLGHTDIHVTLDTYSDVFDRLNHKSISQFEGYMTNQYNEVFVP